MADRSFADDGAEVPAWIRSEMRDEFGGASILLVEDDPDIRDLLSTLLKLAGFTPTVCSNAEFGLEQMADAYADLIMDVLHARPSIPEPLPLGQWRIPAGFRPGLRTLLPRPVKNWLRMASERR